MGGVASSRTSPVSRWFSSKSPIVSGSCWFLPRPPGSQGFEPQSLRASAFSTLGFLHDRGHSNPLIRTLTLPSDIADGSSRSVATEQTHQCTRLVGAPRHRGRR